MKKVLIIGFMWPYHTRGSGRVPGLAKYLPEFGWEPIVVTAPLDRRPESKYRIIETPYKGVFDFWLKLFRFKTDASTSVREQAKKRVGGTSKKSIRGTLINFAFTRLLEIIDYPDIDKRWLPAALRACTELFPGEQIRAVISSSLPVTGHIIAAKLKNKYQVPWVADMPHLWSQNNSYTYSSLRRMVDRRLERKTLSRVDSLTTTSQPLADKLMSLHKNKTVHSIAHGFDPDTVNIPPDKLTDKFTITYTGGFHPVLRTPSLLFTALQSLISKGFMEREKVEVRFFGSEESWIENEIEKYGLSGVVKQYGRVTMASAQAKQRESQLLFNPKWDDPREPGIHSLKLLEYLAARRPILATGKYRDVADELLAETGAGIYAADAASIEQTLIEAYQEYKRKGSVTWHGDDTKINGYSQREMARKFARVLDSLT